MQIRSLRKQGAQLDYEENKEIKEIKEQTTSQTVKANGNGYKD